MSKQKEEKVIMRHILEVRLKKRLFSFMDFRGRMVEYITGKLKLDQIKLQNDGSRFDVADNSLENVYFFSIENFGFQSEFRTSFEDFSFVAKKIIDALSEFPEYKIDHGCARIGTKSIILYHRKGDSLQKIKDAYRELLNNNSSELSRLTKSSILDTGHTFDLKLENSKASVLTGPVSRVEAVTRFFDGNDGYIDKFERDNGMLLAIDVFGNNSLLIKDFDGLKSQVDLQIMDIKTVFDGFKGLFSPTE